MNKWVFLLLLGCSDTPSTPQEARNPERGFKRTLTYDIVRPIESIEVRRDGVRVGQVPASGRVRVIVHTTHVCVICIRGIDEDGYPDGGWVCKRSFVEVEDVF